MRRGGAAKEWPLVGFTLLAQTAVGAFWALTAAEAFFASEGALFLDSRALLVILILAGAGTLLSLFHLGRPLRAANALANLRSSWLSREILADLVFLASGAALWLMETGGFGSAALRTGLMVLGAVSGFALLCTMSRLYMLRTVPVWKGPHTPVSFFLTALFLGPLLAAALTPAFDEYEFAARWIYVAIALAASGLAFVGMALFTPTVGWLSRPSPTLLAYPRTKIMSHLAVRAVLLLAAAACLLLFLLRSADGSPAPLSLIAGSIAAVASEIAGRALFYAMYSRVGV